MTKTHTYRGIAWIDLESPEENEIASLVKRYDLHPLVGEELKSTSSLAKIAVYKDYAFVVLTVPVRVRHGAEGYTIEDREIDFVIGKHFLITSRSGVIEELDYFAKVFEANAILEKNEHIEHAGHLFYYMIKRLYSGMYNDLENIRDALLAAESDIFRGNERTMVEELSRLSRQLIDFRQTARVHRDVWEDLDTSADASLFGEDYRIYINDIKDEFNRIHELTVNARELLADLRETNDSLLNTKQNEIIKVLTLVSFIFYPLTFIASIFTIPGVDVPLTSQRADWWIILVSMIVVAIIIWFFFKKRRWV